MRILVWFDLPVKTSQERKAANQFRKFLLKDGYHMMQLSVYTRLCNGTDDVYTHRNRIHSHLPRKGSVRMLTLTEKQYESIDILLGGISAYEKEPTNNTLDFF